jgi:hypothetical protein
MGDVCNLCERADCPRYNGLDVWCEPVKCERCHRITLCSVHGRERLAYPAHCHKDGAPDPTCDVVAAAYQRGLRAGVELAKYEAFIVSVGSRDVPCSSHIDWTDVDAALAEKLKGAVNE